MQIFPVSPVSPVLFERNVDLTPFKRKKNTGNF